MVEIKSIAATDSFRDDLKKVRDRALKERLQKQIAKVAEDPGFGKPLRYSLKGEWSIYVKPYRLIYKIEGDRLILLRFEHRKEAYQR